MTLSQHSQSSRRCFLPRMQMASLTLLGWCLLIPRVGLGDDDEEKYRAARLALVAEAVAPEGVTNPAVLESMRAVPRHMFVAANLRERAYTDQALAIGHKQTISPPFIVAYMTQVIDPQPTDRVLEIGTGSGYQAAILSGIVKDVYTIEIVEELGKAAAQRLKDLGYDNVHPKIGDGYKGWVEHAPFDKIIVTCSPEDVPQPLIDQLREGGKMIIPLGERYQQVFYLFEKQGANLVKTKLLPTLFVPMTGISEEKRQVKPDPLHPTVLNGSFEDKEENEGRPINWHYQRQLTVERTQAPDGATFVTFRNTDPGRTSQCLQGMALDGRQIKSVRTSLWVRASQVQRGTESWEQPALVVHFFDAERRRIGESHLGPWQGSFPWKQVSGDLAVPRTAREAIIYVGLHGGTGELSVDKVQISARQR